MTAGRRLFLLIVIAIISYIGIGLLVSAFEVVSCADGWRSSSIGRSGACSHHGGVGFRAAGFVALLGSAGMVLFFRKRLVVSITDEESSWIYKNTIYDIDGRAGVCKVCLGSPERIKMDGKYFSVCPKAYNDFKNKTLTCQHPDRTKIKKTGNDNLVQQNNDSDEWEDFLKKNVE